MTALGPDFLKSVIFTAAWLEALAREGGKREVTASLQVGLSAVRARRHDRPSLTYGNHLVTIRKGAPGYRHERGIAEVQPKAIVA